MRKCSALARKRGALLGTSYPIALEASILLRHLARRWFYEDLPMDSRTAIRSFSQICVTDWTFWVALHDRNSFRSRTRFFGMESTGAESWLCMHLALNFRNIVCEMAWRMTSLKLFFGWEITSRACRRGFKHKAAGYVFESKIAKFSVLSLVVDWII